MSYAELTREDPNACKRWLQARRIAQAIALIPAGARRVVDYGGGDGEVSARLARARPGIELLCFEPTPSLREEARARLAGVAGAALAADEAELTDGWADAALCLEVFEHLPPIETRAAAATLARVLRPGGTLVVGVPVEVGPAALVKGAFRRGRRPHDYDGRPGAIVQAALGRAPRSRPVVEIAPGRPYHPHHLGFDHRRLVRELKLSFTIVARIGSPFGRALPGLSPELYIVAMKPRPSPPA